MEEVKAQLSQSERVNEAVQTALKASVRDLQKDLSEKSRNLSRKSKELEDARSTHTAQIAATERKHHEDLTQAQRRAAAAERFAQDLEAAGFAGDLRTQTSIEQLKEKYAAAMSHLESKLRSESDAVKNLSFKIRYCTFIDRSAQ